MNIEHALNLGGWATDAELRAATKTLKSSFNRSANAINKMGYETELMKTVGANIETNPIYSKPVGKLSRTELQEVYDLYRSAKGHRIIDNGRVIGWEENITSTKAGFIKNQKRVAKEVLGFKDYPNMSQAQQQDLWSRIDEIRNAREGYFLPGSGSYGSGTNIKKVTSWIQQGKTNEEIISLLEGSSTQSKAAEQALIAAETPISPMDLLPTEEEF